jgi:predicted phosphodiesterase
MRIAIVSDIHGNLFALEAVLADLKRTAPDLILHGGDLAHAGANPVAVVDRIRDLGWPGVLGNTDEMLFSPQSLEDFADQTPALQPIRGLISEMAAATASLLGEDRLNWLRTLPRTRLEPELALVHASPADLWRAPMPDADDDALETTYRPMGRGIAVYAHIHRSYVRHVGEMTVANTGSVSLSHDGDPRASFLLIDDGKPQTRRITYDMNREVEALGLSGLPHTAWTTKILQAARPQMP